MAAWCFPWWQSFFFFKLALFPFHVWASGVYQGAANQVTAYIATATKVAAVALLIRIVALGHNSIPLAHILVVLSICSMTLVIIKVASDGRDLKIAQLAGLHRRSPLLAMALMLGLFSLGGIPPTIGFTGKFLVFVAAVQKGYVYLVFIGMVNVVISLYYYALVVKAAFLLEPEEALPRIQLSWPARLFTGAMVLVLVIGGIFPNYLYTLAIAAARVLR